MAGAQKLHAVFYFMEVMSNLQKLLIWNTARSQVTEKTTNAE